jgi:hypothetical protein
MARLRVAWRRRTPRRRPLRRPHERDAPIRARSLLSPGELAFFRVLSRSLPRHSALSLKTRLADIIDCPDELWHAPLGRRVAQKHVDFALYDPVTGKILAVIELDDRSHDSPTRRRRDRFLDGILQEVGVPLLRVRCASSYCNDDLFDQLAHALRESTKPRRRLPHSPVGSR